MAKLSETWTWMDGDWHEGNVLVAGPRTHAFWLGSSVFDGARAFEGVTPDLDRHCERLNASARALSLKPTQPVETIVGLVKDGLKRFRSKEAIYVRPMYWAEEGGVVGSSVPPNPETTRFLLCLYVAPMNPPRGFSITLSPFRRPSMETMPTDAKAGCLYPNNARCVMEAKSRGFDNALVLDMLGNVAEAGTSNLFMVKDGVVKTPGAERHVPGRHHSPADHRASTRCRCRGAGDNPEGGRLHGRGRDLLDRKQLEGGGDQSDRKPSVATRTHDAESAQALLGLGA
jgi:branched-chain amino acid aminotransferase